MFVVIIVNSGIITQAYAATPTSTLTVNSPNGGEAYVRGDIKTIRWTSGGSPGSYVKIELLKAGVVNRVISSETSNDGAYSWTIPSTQTLGSDYKIRITSTAYNTINDLSNINFAIASGTPPEIIIVNSTIIIQTSFDGQKEKPTSMDQASEINQ